MKVDQCIHWTGLRHDRPCCEAGVNYRLLDHMSQEPGLFLRLPCTAVTRADMPKRVCEKRQLPTSEQVAADELETEQLFQRALAGMRALEPLRRAHPMGGSGVTDCPICKGRLHWSIAASNGHMHGRCETPECLTFME